MTFLVFVALAESIHPAVLVAAPLDQTSTWLEAHNRVIVIVVGLVFSTWFILKGLDGLGVL